MEGKDNIVNTIKKMTILILATAFLCLSLSSCKKSSSEHISADSLWFDSKRSELKMFPDNEKCEIYRTVFQHKNGEIRVVCECFLPPAEEDLESPEFDDSTCYKTCLCVFDFDGQLNRKIDIKEIILDSIDPYARIRSYGFYNDYLYVLSETDGEHSEDIITIINIETGSVIEEIRFTDDLMRAIRSVYSEEIVLVTENVFMLCADSSKILLFDKDGNYREDDFSELFDIDMFFWDTYSDSNGNVKFSCSTEQNQECNIVLGANTIVYETVNIELGSAFSATVANDGAYYSVGYDGIAKYNKDTSEFEVLAPADSFNINYNELIQMDVLSVTDDEMLLVNTHGTDPKKGIVAYRLTRADSNPNAGKNKIVVGLFGEYVVSSALGKAIYENNANDGKCFASVKVYDYKKSYYENEDAMEIARKEEANILMRDIQDGNGPDLIINAFDIGEISNENYLCDLSSFMTSDKSFNRDDYVSTIFDLSAIDGKLFQIPLQFGTMGISSPIEYAPANGIGYTFEEYSDIVSEANNGADCLAYEMDRSSYYSLLFTASSDDYKESGLWSVDCPEYSALAQYCKEKVPEKCLANYDDEHFVMPEFVVSNPQVEGIGAYVGSVYAHNIELYGYPSANGNHGVMISVMSSAAISSFSNNKDGAWEFIKEMMSYDIQCEETVYSSINLQALRFSGEEAVKAYNAYNAELRTMDQDKLIAMGIHITDDIDNASVDAYINLICNATGVNRMDGQILLITKEEIQPFYVEQKSLSDVTAIMDNRIQTYTKEN